MTDVYTELLQENSELKTKVFRLEQEVEHWKMECREAKAKGEWTYDLVRKKVDRLEQENKELKEDLKSQQMINLKQQEIALDYWNALEEIREIAKFNQFYNPEDLLINGDIGQIQDLKMTEIYNKINEVLNPSS